MSQKKKQIIDAAQRLFIKKGYAMTSIQDILKEANIAKGTFYNYFSSKSECIMFILESINDEILKERIHLSYQHKQDDVSLFAKQLEVRFHIDRKHNLMALFSSIDITDDKDLKSFLEKYYVLELQWFTKRIRELYGKQVEKNALDHAIAFLGLLQHSIQVMKSIHPKVDRTEEMIQFSIRRLEQMVTSELIDNKVYFLHEELDRYTTKNQYLSVKEQYLSVLKRLQQLFDKNEEWKSKEYVSFLLDEIQSESPRWFLIESVMDSLNRISQGSEYEDEVRNGLSLTWHLIENKE